MVTKIGIYRDPRNKGRPWIVRWFTMTDPESGKRRRFCKSFELKRDAERFQREKENEFEMSGRPKAGPDKRTLESFLNDYMRRRRYEVKPSTIEVYENTEKRLIDFFGASCPLQDITQEKAEEFVVVQKNRKEGRIGNSLSAWTREQIKRNAKAIFSVAEQWGQISSNPFTGLKAKRPPSNRWYRMKPEEYHRLLEVTPSLREKVAYAIFYTAGLRLHEAYNLTWDCLDFQKNLLYVLNREATPTIPPFSIKDHESRRIPLPAHTIDLLTQWQAEAPEGVPFVLLTAKRFELVKAKWVRISKSGTPWKNAYVVNNVLRNFKSHYKRAEIKPIGQLTIHTLRKNCGQNWADHLPINVVKEFMGHSHISTTQEFYTAVDRDHELKAAKVIQAMLVPKQNDVSLTYETKIRQF